ncbi:MAG TPA: hypothetical protein VIF02_10950 [Methylocella sp.]
MQPSSPPIREDVERRDEEIPYPCPRWQRLFGFLREPQGESGSLSLCNRLAIVEPMSQHRRETNQRPQADRKSMAPVVPSR